MPRIHRAWLPRQTLQLVTLVQSHFNRAHSFALNRLNSIRFCCLRINWMFLHLRIKSRYVSVYSREREGPLHSCLVRVSPRWDLAPADCYTMPLLITRRLVCTCTGIFNHGSDVVPPFEFSSIVAGLEGCRVRVCDIWYYSQLHVSLSHARARNFLDNNFAAGQISLQLVSGLTA